LDEGLYTGPFSNRILDLKAIILILHTHPDKTAPFLWARGTDERLTRHLQSPTYVDSRAAQGLEAPSRTSASHLTPNPERRPPFTQPWSQLVMATCPGQRTVKATRGKGYAPARGTPEMMMILYG